ncbi:pseudouridine synthase [Azospirillum sp. RWY-5-1]|uniref:Pseudouridine synthase n=1 Tax=Azospirillum oleiclasticum TaxID=2735135 RepID=A0ABX2TDE8_9PROT|nr:pseudouridine synthase [Azospirillum oleiclasticum]NYZ15273.1 pseudouridine synthase [Azospirillum oleiclasticum]NYZ21306.1 pseudouridine synthase [Azospirillum oleiclasticum]
MSDSPIDTDSVPDSAPEATPEAGERIAKRLARAGLCSRRDAERWVEGGRVSVNGQVLASPAFVVRPGDLIVVDGKPLPEPEPARLWRYHKPAGLVTTARDEKGRTTVFDRLPPDLPRVVSVGRLDLTTEGLLLLTNDGELARYLELPTTGWTRRYRVRVHGTVDEPRLAALMKGPTIDGVKYGPIEATLDRVTGSNAWLSVSLKEGKNREIRKVMEAMDLQVTRLIRVAYGPFQLGKLEEGAVEEVPKRVVRDQMARFFGGGDEAPKPAGGTATAKQKPPQRPRAAPKPADGPRGGGPKPGGSRSDGPRSDRPRSDGPRSDGPRSDRPRSDGPRSDGPRSDGPRSDGPRSDGPRSDRPRSDGPRSDGPRAAGPRSDGPRAAGPKPAGSKPSGPKRSDAKAAAPKPAGSKPRGPKPAEAAPAGRGRPEGRPARPASERKGADRRR